MMPKIFIIGFNRCGTTSLHNFFTAAGLRSVHWDGGRLAVTMTRNARAGHRVIAGYEDYDVFSETNFSCVHGLFYGNQYFREIAEQEPDALFILNVRDVDRWLRSRRYWYDTGPRSAPNWDLECSPPACRWELTQAYLHHLKLDSVEDVLAHWRDEWHAHLAAVQSDLPPDRLLVFNIEQDDPLALCRFTGLPDHLARNWQVAHRSYRVTPILANSIPWAIRRRLPKCFKRRVRQLSSLIEKGIHNHIA